MVKPFFRWLRRIISRDNKKDSRNSRDNDQDAVCTERIAAAGHGHRQSANGESKQDDQRNLSLIFCKLADHGTRP